MTPLRAVGARGPLWVGGRILAYVTGTVEQELLARNEYLGRKVLAEVDQDLRSEMPAHLFDLILCRYVAFTYFAAPLQRKVMVRMLERLRPNGYFVIGAHEQLPDIVPGLAPLIGEPQIFQKRVAPQKQQLGD